MPSESIHEKLQRVRRPHVHIKYSVETEGATVVNELPFVVGVMGDFSGDGIGDLKPLREREFREINRDNFDNMMKSMKPALNFDVKNELGNDPNERLSVNLKFEKMEDFTPVGVAQQVPALKALLEKRDEIIQLKNVLERNGDVEKTLDKYLKDPNMRKMLGDELGTPPEGR